MAMDDPLKDAPPWLRWAGAVLERHLLPLALAGVMMWWFAWRWWPEARADQKSTMEAITAAFKVEAARDSAERERTRETFDRNTAATLALVAELRASRGHGG